MAWKNNYNNDQNLDYNTRYANWNKFYDDLEEEIKNIRTYGNQLLFDLDSKELIIHKYYSLIVNLHSTHRSYIIKAKDIDKKLKKIEDTIFSDSFLFAVYKKPDMIRTLRIKIIRDLRDIFSIMCFDFSLMGLRPKIEEIDTTKYSDLAENEEEKEKLKALESVGIIK